MSEQQPQHARATARPAFTVRAVAERRELREANADEVELDDGGDDAAPDDAPDDEDRWLRQLREALAETMGDHEDAPAEPHWDDATPDAATGGRPRTEDGPRTDEVEGGFCNPWLTVALVDPVVAGFSAEDLRLHLEADDIESRPTWKPMHQQKVFAGCEAVLNGVSDRLFAQGICLPSGSGMSDGDFERVLAWIGAFLQHR